MEDAQRLDTAASIARDVEDRIGRKRVQIMHWQEVFKDYTLDMEYKQNKF